MKSIPLLAAPSNARVAWQNVNEQSMTWCIGLPEFNVTQIAIQAEEIHLKCRQVHAVGVCPKCSTASSQVHGRSERAIRDVGICGKRVFLHVVWRRFVCPSCQQIFTERLRSIGQWRRYTRRYEQAVYAQCREHNRKHVAQKEGLGEATVLGIFVREAEQALEHGQPYLVRRLGMDEIALKKRHKHYALVLTDLDRHCVIAVLPERKKDVVEAWLQALTSEQRQAIDVVSTDLWEPFRQAIRSCLPEARQVADRFHVMRQLNRRLNQARATIYRQGDDQTRQWLKGTRWALVKNPDTLTDKETAQLHVLLTHCEELRDLYLLKEEFRAVCNRVKDRAQASRFLHAWRYKVHATGNPALLKFIASLDQWWDEFLNYFIDRTTQAFPEGIHNAIRVIMRRAYGFRNFDYFRLHVLAQHGAM